MPTILLIDDDDTLLSMYKQHFENDGFSVDTAKDGEEGIEKMRSSKPDIVLLDFLMPKVSGYEMLERVKHDASLKDIPIVFLTNIMVDKQDILKKGAQYCLIKVESKPKLITQIVKTILQHT